MAIPKGRFLTIKERTVRFLRLMHSNPNGCIDWIGAKFVSGYGVCIWRKKRLRAHRVSYELFKGRIPFGAHVLHKCDRPICVNPVHLFLGNPAINNADCIAKGRMRYEHGSQRYNAKLDETKVVQIRYLFSKGETCASLAKLYQVSQAAIRNVILRIKWKHVA